MNIVDTLQIIVANMLIYSTPLILQVSVEYSLNVVVSSTLV